MDTNAAGDLGAIGIYFPFNLEPIFTSFQPDFTSFQTDTTLTQEDKKI